MMELVLVRHGATEGNEHRRYVGKRTDEPLSETGRAQCARADVPRNVTEAYVSPLLRARETAELLFPQARLHEVPGFEEFDFGAFEGKTANDLADDAAYRAWVDGWCVGLCPGGESREEFVRRSNAALEELLRAAHARGERRVVVVAHGGTIMAALSVFAASAATDDGYFEWHVEPCGGYAAEVDFVDGALALTHLRRLGA